MISIIICSINSEALNNAQLNIADTIGVPFEVIGIDNRQNQYGICKAYNEGARQARFPILCFMHEDVLFETRNWGSKLIQHFKDRENGLIGIAGGDAKSRVPSRWSSKIISNEIHIWQHFKHSPRQPEYLLVTNEAVGGIKKKVAVLDGVWLCTTRDVFEQFHFDEDNFKGFHGYDIDFSLQVGTFYDVCVVFDIVIHHFSEGSPNGSWMESAMILSKKWKNWLPVSVYQLSTAEYCLHHWQSMQVFIQDMVRLDFPARRCFYFLIKYSVGRYFRIRKFLSMTKYLLFALRKRYGTVESTETSDNDFARVTLAGPALQADKT